MRHGLHNIAGNGKCDGSKRAVDWVISSQATNGAAMSGGLVEGSTSRTVSANNNRSHERPTAKAADDVLSSPVERRRAWIKSQAVKNARRAMFDRLVKIFVD